MKMVVDIRREEKASKHETILFKATFLMFSYYKNF